MEVDARPNEIVRLWPKLPTAAPPEKVMDVMPVTPIAFDAAATTAFASSAARAAGGAVRVSARVAAARGRRFHIQASNRRAVAEPGCGEPPLAWAAGTCAL